MVTGWVDGSIDNNMDGFTDGYNGAAYSSKTKTGHFDGFGTVFEWVCECFQ